jgi:hypothetical protein
VPAPKRIYHATRLTGPTPTIDGRLDDACWRELGSWAGEFTEFVPNHGATPTKPSELKLLYDDKYVYVGIRAHDNPALVTRFAGPRDTFTGDIVGITFDSYFDHRSAYEFDLTAAGQKLDLLLSNDGWDTTWNAVWDGKVAHDAEGWTAEFRIPLSQLRYNNRQPQVWGMHAWRWIARNNEESDWEVLANDGTGLVYSFGELHGLDLPTPRRHTEIVPYASAKLTTHSLPDAKGRKNETEIAGGADAKLQLSSSFTLDATLNPDFGQVEADPAEMNLSAFETFLSERRPFFLEGKNIFDFSLDEEEPLFYSRRIGHAPTLAARANAYDVPESTSILGAWKVSGKSANGLAIGVLHAATAEEHAKYSDATGEHTESLEPATQYAVVRAQQEINGGQTLLGGIASLTLRTPKSPELTAALPKQAFVGGLDFERYWQDRTYSLTARGIVSHVSGTPEAIALVQADSARYYQRPDADYVRFDPTRTVIDGWGGYVMAGKRSKGHWRYHEKLTAYSPGLDFNDLGYLREADRLKAHTEVAYVEKQPRAFYREYEVRFEYDQKWNYGREYLESNYNGRLIATLANKSSIDVHLIYTPASLDPVALRGGPTLQGTSWWYGGLWASTDSERRWVASIWCDRSASQDDVYRAWTFQPQLKYRPLPAFAVSLALDKRSTMDRHFFVPSSSASGQPAYLVSNLHSDSLAYTARVQWFITPELSIQYYGNPFGSSGRFSNYSRVLDPRATSEPGRYVALPAPTFLDGNYWFDDNRDGRADYSAGRPDFSFGQFRSNLVLRWEFRPGSNLYAVWSQERADWRGDAANTGSVLRRLTGSPQTNVFPVKCSYWYGLR